MLKTSFSVVAALVSGLSLAAPVPAEPAANPRAVVVENVVWGEFPATLAALKTRLMADGWNLVAEIDLGNRLAKRGAVLPGGLVILEMTSGGNTVPLLKDESTRYVSAFMPCSVSVYGKADGSVVISRMNAAALAGMMEPRVAEAMHRGAAQMDASITTFVSQTRVFQ
jgi:uncharacterized protein (DUF302 family)